MLNIVNTYYEYPCYDCFTVTDCKAICGMDIHNGV